MGPGSSQAPAADQPRALFFGDSLFVGVGASPRQPVQARYAASLLGVRPVLDAMSGTGFTTGGRNGLPYLQRLRRDGALRADRYDVVVVEGGTNDAHHGSPSQTQSAATEVLDQVRQAQPHALVVLVGAFVGHGVARHDRYAEVDAALARAAAARDVLYVSQLHWSQQARPGFLSQDRFHPTASGYRLLGAELARAVLTATG